MGFGFGPDPLRLDRDALAFSGAAWRKVGGWAASGSAADGCGGGVARSFGEAEGFCDKALRSGPGAARSG